MNTLLDLAVAATIAGLVFYARVLRRRLKVMEALLKIQDSEEHHLCEMICRLKGELAYTVATRKASKPIEQRGVGLNGYLL